MIEPITIKIEPGPHNRLARIHEALRDLDLELCAQCHVWRGVAHFPATGAGELWSSPCNPCITAAHAAGQTIPLGEIA